jgi:hypothetical protein
MANDVDRQMVSKTEIEAVQIREYLIYIFYDKAL